ncbi:MAG: DUF3990 domain-containing protein [Muribaculaceae bacterium]|nr:DUF3990 domain-containing protein [Muribaculaceae bacterium]
MRLYHGSYCKISKIDFAFARNFKDFGTGFYLTPDFGRAVKMALRSVILNNGGEPEVNPFIFNKSTCADDLKIKEFKDYNWEWAGFVLMNRDKSQNPPYNHDYDIVIGPVADSYVDQVIKTYKDEFDNRFLEPDNLKILASRLKYSGEKYIQYCFCTEKALTHLIKD